MKRLPFAYSHSMPNVDRESLDYAAMAKAAHLDTFAPEVCQRVYKVLHDFLHLCWGGPPKSEHVTTSWLGSWWPAPFFLAVPRVDEDAVRADIRHTLEITRGCVVELIMKDNHTLGKNPDNLVQWVCVAREEIERSAAR